MLARVLALSMFLAGGCVLYDDDGDDDGPGSLSPCGGFSPRAECPADEFCDRPQDTCGVADEPGTCRARPTECPTIYMPVTGCDGVMYPNACSAHAAGTDVAAPLQAWQAPRPR
jgi:hypothetical protein